MLMLMLFGPPLAALFVVARRDYTGIDVARPFRTAGLVAFAISGVFLVATLMGGAMAVNYLLLGTAAFGGAVSCGATAVVIWYREQRRINAARRRDQPWPDREDL